jgi:hypothetical protein
MMVGVHWIIATARKHAVPPVPVLPTAEPLTYDPPFRR